MLTKMSYGEVPGYLRRSNPNKSFAAKTIEEFLELNCDAAKKPDRANEGRPPQSGREGAKLRAHRERVEQRR